MRKKLYAGIICLLFFACSSATRVNFLKRPDSKYSFANKKIGLLLNERVSSSSKKLVLDQYQYNLYKDLEKNGGTIIPIILKNEKHVIRESIMGDSVDPDMAIFLGYSKEVDYVLFSRCKVKLQQRPGSSITLGIREGGGADIIGGSYEYYYIFQLINIESREVEIYGTGYSKTSCEICVKKMIKSIKKGPDEIQKKE